MRAFFRPPSYACIALFTKKQTTSFRFLPCFPSQLTCRRTIVQNDAEKRTEKTVFQNIASTGARLRENVYTIPNLLSVIRIGTTPILGYMILQEEYLSAMGLFAFAGITDLLDGWIARVFPSQASFMGSILDPMADKILVGTVFLSLTYVGLIPALLTCLIVARDLVLIMAGFYLRFKSLDPPRTVRRYFDVSAPTVKLAPTLLSKVNTGVQLGLVAFTLASTAIPYDVSNLLFASWLITAGTTFSSGLAYIFAKDTVKFLKRKKGPS